MKVCVEKVNKMEKVHCPECRKEVEYFTESEIKHHESQTEKFGFVSFDYQEITPICNECKHRLHIDKFERNCNMNFQESLKQAQRKNVGFDYTVFKHDR